MEPEIADSDGTRSEAPSITDRVVLRFLELVVRILVRINQPRPGNVSVTRTRE